jgi:hypothetical protein
MYYHATILAKREVSFERIPAMQAEKLIIYSKHSILSNQAACMSLLSSM